MKHNSLCLPSNEIAQTRLSCNQVLLGNNGVMNKIRQNKLDQYYSSIKIYFTEAFQFHLIKVKFEIFIFNFLFIFVWNLAVLDELGLHDVGLERELVLPEAARVDDWAAVLKEKRNINLMLQNIKIFFNRHSMFFECFVNKSQYSLCKSLAK